MANTIRLRRGLEADRTTITPAEGEMIYTTDTNSLYIGDGSTAGGVKFDFNLDDIDVDTITANQLDINGTVTADGLTVSGASGTLGTITNGNKNLLLYVDNTNVQVGSSLSGEKINFLQTDNSIVSYTSNTIRQKIESNGDISFYEDTGTTAKFFWDASAESLGIGTSSPSHKLQVDGGTTYLKDTLYIAGGIGAKVSSDSTSNPLIFGRNNVEDMRIDSSGNCLVGKTSTDFGVAGVNLESGGNLGVTRSGAAPANFNRLTSDGDIARFFKDGTTVGSISVTSSATSYNTSSDYRLKTDVQPMTGATERLKALKPVNFEWISSGERVDGFLAHEAQEVVPEAVTGTKDAMRTEEYEVTPAVEATYNDEGNELTAAVEAVMGTREVPDYQGIDQSKLVPLLVSAIQELTAKVEALENAQ